MSHADGGERRAGPSRRWVLAGGAAALLGGGVGVAAGYRQSASTATPHRAPAALTDAVAAERHLLALAAAAARRDPALRADVVALTRDHTAHLRALRAVVAGYDTSPAVPAPMPPTLTSTPSIRAQLRSAERAAAATAAAHAGELTGAVAALLASISACESTHVELLT